MNVKSRPARVGIWASVVLIVVIVLSVGYVLRFPSGTSAPRDAQVAFLAAKALIAPSQEQFAAGLRRTGSADAAAAALSGHTVRSNQGPIIWATVLVDGAVVAKASAALRNDGRKQDVYFLFFPRTNGTQDVKWTCSTIPPEILPGTCD